MKNSYQPKVILRVLLVSETDIRPELSTTMIGRQGIEIYRVEKLMAARLVSSSLGVQVILVDGDFPDALGFVAKLRKDAATRNRSIAVLSRGSRQNSDREALAAGANAIFRLPPDALWDERFAKLLEVPVRQQARLAGHIKLPTELERPAAILNISPGGMLLATDQALHRGDEFKFRFTLPGDAMVVGQGRVAREAKPTGFGIEFIDLDDEGKGAVMDFLRSAHLE